MTLKTFESSFAEMSSLLSFFKLVIVDKSIASLI